MGVSENRGSQYNALNSRILNKRTPKSGTPTFGISLMIPKEFEHPAVLELSYELTRLQESTQLIPMNLTDATNQNHTPRTQNLEGFRFKA